MDGSPAIYLGRIVSKENFRAFIYAPNGTKRLAESWDEFEASMQSGLWFATAFDAKESAIAPTLASKVKTRTSRAKKVEFNTPDKENDIDDLIPEELIHEDAAFEVTDDFLPSKG